MSRRRTYGKSAPNDNESIRESNILVIEVTGPRADPA